MKNFFIWFENWEVEKKVYRLILKGVSVVAVIMAAFDYFFYSPILAYLELNFALVSMLLLYGSTSGKTEYTISSRAFLVAMSLPIYWNLLYSESYVESTILFVFLPLLTIILRPLKEVFIFATIFGGSFLYINLSGMSSVSYTYMELFKLISVQFLVSFFVAIYVHINKNFQEIITTQSQKLQETNSKLEKLYKEKEIEASTDFLTSLKNRTMLMQRLEHLFARYKRHKETFSLIIFDIDNFKDVNDTYGHTKGDDILKEVAKVALENIREVDMAARYGGEEFVILLPQTDSEHAMLVAERTRKSMAEKVKIEGKSVTASFGVVEIEEDMRIQDIIHLGDLALYRAKETGRNRVEEAIRCVGDQ